ncbi:PmoA family protein [Actinoplanes auranticolor]|uniref:Oxidoreductase n=1 Tax=Actinoplanes auranticolor TaxID=47988 RepID=A0A919SC81_9ACTN|nr:PmoA family protein [Actinoplanes auranticolor]GIM68979.1 oxidoreductase [Actinoplanes auranticolor]
MRLAVGDVDVAEYVTEPEVDPLNGPRPYLHPVRTLAGVPVTDVLPEDHRWHLGVSVAMQDVNGVNLWGGRTYVRDQGYTWLDDHGRIIHAQWLAQAAGGFSERLRWLGTQDETLLTETRTVAARAVPLGWELSFSYALSAAGSVTLGSPATNGRPGGAGYGGFFWRAAPGPATAFTASRDGEEAVNGSDEPWVAITGPGPYTLVFRGLRGDDRWFVRTGAGGYNGVCAALAFDKTIAVTPGAPVERDLTVLVADGALTREQITG